MHLSRATWPDIADCETDLAVLPVGSTEQHGPHAPLGTDVIGAEAIADAAVEAYDGTVIRAPAISVGVAAEHRQFAGTLWVSPETFRNYVRETITALGSHGFDRIVVVNGHGGNVAALGEVTASVTRSKNAYAVPFTWFDALSEELPGEMGHAGSLETALMCHLVPEAVRTDRFEAAATEAAAIWGDWVAGVNLAHDTEEFAPNGVVGDPRKADAEMGAEVLEVTAAALVELLEALAERSLP